MKKVNFSNIEIKDIKWNIMLNEWKPLEIYKFIANALYAHWKTIEISELAKRIYEWKEVELRDNEIAEIKSIILDEQKFNYIELIRREVIKEISK